jgi:chromosomal replication initiator protein
MNLPAKYFFRQITPTQMRLAQAHRERTRRVQANAVKPGRATASNVLARKFKRQFDEAWRLLAEGDLAAPEPMNSVLPEPMTMRAICGVVCKHYGINKNDLTSIRRTAPLVRARFVVVYLARTLTPMSYPEMGRRLGGRDHTTVLHAHRRMVALLQTDSDMAALVADLIQQLSPPKDQP